MQYQPLFSDKKIIKFKVNLKKNNKLELCDPQGMFNRRQRQHHTIIQAVKCGRIKRAETTTSVNWLTQHLTSPCIWYPRRSRWFPPPSCTAWPCGSSRPRTRPWPLLAVGVLLGLQLGLRRLHVIGLRLGLQLEGMDNGVWMTLRYIYLIFSELFFNKVFIGEFNEPVGPWR